MGFLEETLDGVGENRQFNKGFEAGTHEVIIGEAEATTKDTKKVKAAPIIRVLVFDEQDNDKQATCTLWFHSEGGAKMSVAKILGILIHNVGEEKKDQVRELGRKLFGQAKDAEEARKIAIKLIEDKLIGKKAYLVSDPQGDYTTTAFGDLWHYPAKANPQPVKPTTDVSQAPGVAADEIPDFEEGDV